MVKPSLATTHLEKNEVGQGSQKMTQVQIDNNIAQEDGITVLKATFPNLDDEQIKTFYELNGNNVNKAKIMINQQLGLYTEEEEEEEGIDMNEVEFDLLAGQIDPNAISEEERKMIEQALRGSQSQEHQVAQQVQQMPRHMHAVNQAQINQQLQIEQQKEQMQQNLPDEEELGSELNERNRRKNTKRLKKVNKKDGNRC